MFFSISTFFEFLCVILYAFVFPKLPIVKYYRSKAASEGSKTVSADLAASGIQTPPEEVLINFFSYFPFELAMEIPSCWDSDYNIVVFLSQAMEDLKQLERKGNKQLILENIDYAVDLFLIYDLLMIGSWRSSLC